MRIPYKDDLITVTVAADIIAEHVYPDFKRGSHGRRAARSRVLQQFRQAYKEGAFGDARYKLDNELNAIDLFTWACAQKKWRLLTNLKGLPREVYGAADFDIESTMTASAFCVPATFEEAVTRLSECEQQLAACNKNIQGQQADLDNLAKLRRRKREISAKNSANGKLAKGVRKLRN